MNIDDINNEWAVDCQINRNDLVLETLRTPILHQKYLSLLMSAKQKLIKYSKDFDTMKGLRSSYYQGTLSKDELDEYGWSQYQGLKPLKSDMDTKLDSDKELQKIKLKVEYMEALHFQLESIMGAIKGRDWTIKNHIEISKFLSGN